MYDIPTIVNELYGAFVITKSGPGVLVSIDISEAQVIFQMSRINAEHSLAEVKCTKHKTENMFYVLCSLNVFIFLKNLYT